MKYPHCVVPNKVYCKAREQTISTDKINNKMEKKSEMIFRFDVRFSFSVMDLS